MVPGVLLAARPSAWQFVTDNAAELGRLTGEHLLMLTVIPVTLAVAIGVPLGVLILRKPMLRGGILGAAGVVQTIPSIAMLALLQILLSRIGTMPAVIALVLYALLPIVRNTYTGLAGVSPAVVEAARGMGFTPTQRLWRVEVPLALPVIVAGIRTAAVIDVGIATLAAFIGAGGLGDFIVQGLSLNNERLILLGVAAAAGLALLTDAGIGLIERALKKGDSRGTNR